MRSLIPVLLVATCWALPAAAQDAPGLLPPWTMRTCSGEQYACYDLEGARQLLLLEENARHWKAELDIQVQLVADLEATVVNLNRQLEVEERIIAEYETENTRLSARLNEEIAEKNKWRADAESPDIWPILIGGSIGVIGASIAVGVLLAN